MSGFLPSLRPQPRSRSARGARHLSRRFEINPCRKPEKGRGADPMRARLRRLSREAGWKAVLLPARGQRGCDLPTHLCVAICPRKSVSCPVMRRECAAGADLGGGDLMEARDDG